MMVKKKQKVKISDKGQIIWNNFYWKILTMTHRMIKNYKTAADNIIQFVIFNGKISHRIVRTDSVTDNAVLVPEIQEKWW